MTGFEWRYLALQYGLPVLQRRMRQELHTLLVKARNGAELPQVLDVGGRKSHSTIGVPGRITVSDLPRASAVQHELGLGLDDELMAQLQERRSNIEQVVYDDMTQSRLPDAAYDIVMAVEVLEHVEADDLFVQHVARVLKSNGVFLMSTPNGDFLENFNPDHKRHYRREQLAELLQCHFPSVEVEYAVPGTRFRRWGLRSWSVRRPVNTLLSISGNLVNAFEARDPRLKTQASGTHHLIARARKAG